MKGKLSSPGGEKKEKEMWEGNKHGGRRGMKKVEERKDRREKGRR